MERIPGVKFVGELSDEQQELLHADLLDTVQGYRKGLSEEALKILEANEIEKSPEHLMDIDLINTETNKLLVDLGLKGQNVSYDRIILLREGSEVLPKGLSGVCDVESGRIFVEDSSSSIYIASCILHEMLHLKGVQTFSVSSEEAQDAEVSLVTKRRRDGISSYRVGDKFQYFQGIHEAIVATLEQRLLPTIIKANPFLQKEKIKTDEYLQDQNVRATTEEIFKDDNQVFDESEIIALTVLEGVDGRIIRTWKSPYFECREVLSYICEEVSASNSSAYPTKEDVLKEFLRGQFGGQILPIGRLMKFTFGDKGLNIIATMVETPESAKETLEKLKALRL